MSAKQNKKFYEMERGGRGEERGGKGEMRGEGGERRGEEQT
jgi:hypothetical protein